MIKFDKNKDTVSFIAPSSACADDERNMCLKKSYKRLEKVINLYTEQGFHCVYDSSIFIKNKLGFVAAPKNKRLRQLKEAILDSEVKIIVAFRGGYGATEIVFDCLDIVPTTPKIMIGFSDITALHFLFKQHYNLPTIHGTMDADNEEMIREIFHVLDGKKMRFRLSAINQAAEQSNNLDAEIVGGNLTLIINMIGTKLQPKFDQKILFIEDVNEKSYAIHRSLIHMKNANLFKNAKAIIFGEFLNTGQDTIKVINDFVDSYLYDIPTFVTSEIGHGKINLPVVIGGDGNINNGLLNVSSPFKLV